MPTGIRARSLPGTAPRCGSPRHGLRKRSRPAPSGATRAWPPSSPHVPRPRGLPRRSWRVRPHHRDPGPLRL